jgi:glycosyltransferase involved in cell wall biosynthesis
VPDQRPSALSIKTNASAIQKMKKLISVIIPHLNQPEELEACLRSLFGQKLDSSAFEVIVVDNGSRSLPQAIVERYPGTTLLQELAPGPGPARNRGADAASADILAFTDSDCRVHPDWLESAHRTLNDAPERTILGGDVQIWLETGQPISAIQAYESVFAYRFKLYIEQHGFSGTGNLVMRKRDFVGVGPFRGIDVAEDVEWGRRALAAGYAFRYAPEMIVYHPARRSLKELFVKWDRHIQHAVNERDEHLIWYVRWLSRALVVMISPAVDWIKVIASDRIAGASPRAKAILVLALVRCYRAYRMVTLLMSPKQVQWNRNSAIQSDSYNKR